MRLKNYVFFRETDKGVWFDAGRRSFALNGQGIYPLVERLLNALEMSGRSPGDLVAGLPDKLKPLAGRLFGELARHEMLQREDATGRDSASNAHSAQVEFLKYLEDNIADASLGTKLARWRNATIAIVGDGYAAKAAAGVLADSGCGTLLLRCTSTEEVGLEEFEQALRHRGDSVIDVAVCDSDPAAIPLEADALLIAGGEHFSVERAAAYARQGRNAGMTVCVSVPVNGHLAVLSTVAADMPGIADLADWLLPPTEWVTPSPVNLAIAGSIAAQEMITRFFEIGATADATARIVSPYSEVSVCPVPASPRRHADDVVLRSTDVSARMEMPEERDLSPYERLRISLAPWADPALSVLSQELPVPLPQLPLYHEAFAVRQAGMGRENVQIAVGWGVSPEEAGLRASMNAIALLARQEFGAGPELIAGLGERAWRSASLARAFIRSGRFATDARWGLILADEIDDPEARVALQILRFQVASPISLRVGFVPGVEAVVVSCHAGEAHLSCVCLTSLDEALRESIGMAISKIQLRAVDRVVRPDEIEPMDLQPISLLGRAAIMRAIDTAADDIPVRFVRSQRLGLPEAVACGYAVIEEETA